MIWVSKQYGIEYSNKKRNRQNYSKSKTENIKFDNLVHQTEEYKLFELQTKVEQNTNHIPINIPTMCPICGHLNIEGYFKYKIKNKEEIKIFLCEKHYWNLEKKPSFINNKIDLILILGFILISISGILIYLSTQNLNIIIFSGILIANGGLLFSVYSFKKFFENYNYNRHIAKIYDHVRLGFSKDSVLIRIKNSDWEREFKRLNDWKEIPYDSEVIKEHRKMGLKWAIFLIFWIIISIPVTIISSIYFPIFYAKLIIYFFVFIPLFIIVLILIFHFSKEQRLKSFTSSQSQRIVIITILL